MVRGVSLWEMRGVVRRFGCTSSMLRWPLAIAVMLGSGSCGGIVYMGD